MGYSLASIYIFHLYMQSLSIYLSSNTAYGHASILAGSLFMLHVISKHLGYTSQVSAQFEILLRSAFKHSAAVTGSSTIINRLVSSANSRMFAPISLTMSLI